MKVSVLLFPGSNCDHDVAYTYSSLLKCQVEIVWHRSEDLKKPDLVLVPGGFSYGDYLRSGAMAKLSPVMKSVCEFAERGGPVLGICNGFQILCEAGLLPGALLSNIGTRFLSRFVTIRADKSICRLSVGMQVGDRIHCPIAHFDGNYFAEPEDLERIEGEGQVVFRYCNASGEVLEGDRESNPNGSLNAIAGVCNAAGNVLGMMPHPERSVEELVGGPGAASGLKLLAGIDQLQAA